MSRSTAPLLVRVESDGQAGCVIATSRRDILVAFANRRATRLKLLWFDRNGYCLLYKRLHGALFALPRSDDGASAVRVDGGALATLLAGVERAPLRSVANRKVRAFGR